MIFDGTLFDSFQEQYGVRNIETYVETASPFSSRGSLSPNNTAFEIEKLDVPDDALWVAKFDMERHDLATVEVLAKKLISEFPEKTIIFISKDINIETMGAEGIAALCDQLNSILEDLNYDNIMGVLTIKREVIYA